MTVHDTGFHEGEREVQTRAGVREEAARLEGMLAPAGLRGGSALFLAAQAFAVLVARDQEGGLWASPLIARPGFLRGQDRVLAVHATPDPGDPLHELRAGQDVAVIAPDLERRRRVRVNGRLTGAGTNGLTIEVDEAYGNCPAYIRQRAVTTGPGAEENAMVSALDEDGVLTPEAARIVTSSDTFFLGSQHPDRGADASHKGGDLGFVRVEGADVMWPDYAGNNMFNSLGNLAVDPRAALLFIDFDTGRVLQLSGTAELEWRSADPAIGDTGRWVRFRPADGVLRSSPVRGRARPPRPAASNR